MEAGFELGFIHECGSAVPKDCPVAAAWYRESAERDIPKTQRRLGHMYEWNLTVDLGRGRQKKPSS